MTSNRLIHNLMYLPPDNVPFPEPSRRATEAAKVLMPDPVHWTQTLVSDDLWLFIKRFFQIAFGVVVLWLIFSAGNADNHHEGAELAYQIGSVIGDDSLMEFPSQAFIECKNVLVGASAYELEQCYSGVLDSFDNRQERMTIWRMNQL